MYISASLSTSNSLYYASKAVRVRQAEISSVRYEKNSLCNAAACNPATERPSPHRCGFGMLIGMRRLTWLAMGMLCITATAQQPLSPVSVGIVFDTSGSMGAKLGRSRQLATQFLLPAAQIFIDIAADVLDKIKQKYDQR